MPVKIVVVADDAPDGELLDVHIEGFFDDLRSRGYAVRGMPVRRRTVERFAQWAMCAQICVSGLLEVHVDKFLGPVHSTRLARERAVLRRLLQYLRREGVLAMLPIGSAVTLEGRLLQRYVRFLRKDRGLSENSVNVYRPFVRAFLAERAAEAGESLVETIDARTIRTHLLAQAQNGSSENARLLGTSLRSFLRFLFLRAEKDRDLSVAVPRVRKWSQAGVPAVLSPDEVERTLSTLNRDTPIGRRDHAILLLLARLGLRAGEVVTLELCDIHWRQGEIVVRGKGGNTESLPLPLDTGEALALYLRKDRVPRSSRRVFLRAIPPRVGLTGPAAVGHVVRKALARAGLRSTSRRGAAHLFRHSLATKMLRNGASMAEIAQILRHHSPGATETYAKVDFESLREVARPWPGMEGSR